MSVKGYINEFGVGLEAFDSYADGFAGVGGEDLGGDIFKLGDDCVAHFTFLLGELEDSGLLVDPKAIIARLLFDQVVEIFLRNKQLNVGKENSSVGVDVVVSGISRKLTGDTAHKGWKHTKRTSPVTVLVQLPYFPDVPLAH